MTARERLNRRKRWLGSAVLAGIGLALAGAAVAAAGGGGAAAVPVVAGVVLLFTGAVLGQFGALKCPWCRENLGRLLMNAGWWRMDPKVRYCPYCGTELDAQVGGDGIEEAEKDAAGW